MAGVAVAGDRFTLVVKMFAIMAAETAAVEILTVADVVDVGVPPDRHRRENIFPVGGLHPKNGFCNPAVININFRVILAVPIS